MSRLITIIKVNIVLISIFDQNIVLISISRLSYSVCLRGVCGVRAGREWRLLARVSRFLRVFWALICPFQS